MGRAARGVRGIRLRSGDVVVGMDVAHEDKNMLVVSKNGYGKMTKIDNFPAHKRGGVGIKTAVVNDKTGNVVTVKSLEATAHEVLMISSKGQAIRVGLQDIPLLGRTTQGVRIMRLKDSDEVASLGIIPDQENPTLTAEEEEK